MLNDTGFRIAKLASFQSDFIPIRQRMGCAIIRGGRVLSFASNRYVTNPNFPQLFSTHAEIRAIILAETDIYGADAYIFRTMANGKPGMARPCKVCLPYLIENGIRRIFYSIPTEPFFEEITL